MLYSKDDRDQLERDRDYWRDKAAQYQRAEEQASERAFKEQQERQQERRRGWEEARRQVKTWPEAFARQQALYEEQLRLERTELDEEYRYEDHWTEGLATVAKAQKRYQEKMVAVERLRRAVLGELAAEFEEKDASLAEALREDDPSAWLQW